MIFEALKNASHDDAGHDIERESDNDGRDFDGRDFDGLNLTEWTKTVDWHNEHK